MVDSIDKQSKYSTDRYSQEEIKEWITANIAELIGIDFREVEEDVPFHSYGLDSSDAISMAGDLEEWLEQELNATLFYDYPTIEVLAAYLSENYTRTVVN